MTVWYAPIGAIFFGFSDIREPNPKSRFEKKKNAILQETVEGRYMRPPWIFADLHYKPVQ